MVGNVLCKYEAKWMCVKYLGYEVHNFKTSANFDAGNFVEYKMKNNFFLCSTDYCFMTIYVRPGIGRSSFDLWNG